jgi:hypothetical protein
MDKVIKHSDYRIAYIYRWFNYPIELQLLHLASVEKEGLSWIMVPGGTKVGTAEDPSLDIANLSEMVPDNLAYLLLSCAIIEYADAINNLQDDKQALDYYTSLRDTTIKSLEQFFPQSGEAVANLRLANVQTEIYAKLFQQTAMFRSWLAGRYVQFMIDSQTGKEAEAGSEEKPEVPSDG